MIVRRARLEDIPAIVAMSAKFYPSTSYASACAMDADTVADLTRMLIDSGVMLVAESSDGAVVGMVGLYVGPFVFNRHVRSAHEVVWWVEPTAQGAGVGRALLDAVEPACIESGASIIQMLHLENSPPQAAALYERMGYRRTEVCFSKEV